jgi:hypothetical protein
MRRALVALNGAVLLAGLTLPVHSGDIERMVQGGFGGYKYQAKERLKINYNNDVNFTTFFFDHNPDMPEGNLMCIAGQVVDKGSRRHFKRARTEGALVTAEGNYDLRRFNLKYELTDPDDIIPGLGLFFPPDKDLYLWNRPAIWNQTVGGKTFENVYQETQGQNVIFTNLFLNRGRESEGDWAYGTCYAYLGEIDGFDFGAWQSQVVADWVLSAALQSLGGQ